MPLLVRGPGVRLEALEGISLLPVLLLLRLSLVVVLTHSVGFRPICLYVLRFVWSGGKL